MLHSWIKQSGNFFCQKKGQWQSLKVACLLTDFRHGFQSLLNIGLVLMGIFGQFHPMLFWQESAIEWLSTRIPVCQRWLHDIDCCCSDGGRGGPQTIGRQSALYFRNALKEFSIWPLFSFEVIFYFQFFSNERPAVSLVLSKCFEAILKHGGLCRRPRWGTDDEVSL